MSIFVNNELKKMKQLFFILIFLLIKISSFAGNIEVSVQLCKFNHPEKGPFVETYISVDGNSVKWTKTNGGKMQSSIQISLLFSKGDSIITYNNYTLQGPEVDSTQVNKPTFFDVKRYFLPSDNYVIELSIKDANDNKNEFTAKQPYQLKFELENPSFSSIEFLRSYNPSTATTIMSKNGLELIPYMSDYFSEKNNEMAFYGELYNSNKLKTNDEKILITFSIEDYESNQVLEKFVAFKKFETKAVVPFVQIFDISTLQSGNYNLIIEAKNKNNEVFASSKLFFQRSLPFKMDTIQEYNPLASIENTFVEKITNKDTLSQLIRCLRPISDRMEVEFARNVVTNNDQKKMQLFLYQFWLKRDKNNPKKPFDFYMNEVAIVNKMFGTNTLKGFQTDRGRVYLQYGKPDSRDVHENDPGTYPYEIWQFYKLNNRTNRRFVFYNPELATNRWMLLHSDAIGERRDDRWQTVLQRRSNFNNNMDVEKGKDYMGNRIDENFTNPR